MGTNYVDFLIEATRILKMKGRIVIAEVKSRITSVALFCQLLKLLGFHIIKNQKIGGKNQNKKHVIYIFIYDTPPPL